MRRTIYIRIELHDDANDKYEEKTLNKSLRVEDEDLDTFLSLFEETLMLAGFELDGKKLELNTHTITFKNPDDNVRELSKYCS